MLIFCLHCLWLSLLLHWFIISGGDRFNLSSVFHSSFHCVQRMLQLLNGSCRIRKRNGGTSFCCNDLSVVFQVDRFIFIKSNFCTYVLIKTEKLFELFV